MKTIVAVKGIAVIDDIFDAIRKHYDMTISIETRVISNVATSVQLNILEIFDFHYPEIKYS